MKDIKEGYISGYKVGELVNESVKGHWGRYTELMSQIKGRCDVIDRVVNGRGKSIRYYYREEDVKRFINTYHFSKF